MDPAKRGRRGDFLGKVCQECGDLALTGQAAQGLGRSLRSLVADIEGMEGDLGRREQCFHGEPGEASIDLDRGGGRGRRYA